VSAVLLRLTRRASALLLAELACGLVALSLAIAAPSPELGLTALRLASATGGLSLSNSKEGAAILQGQILRPGDQVSGSVRIGNTGSVSATLAVRRVTESETGGTGGGVLSTSLQLVVFDITDAQAPVTKYVGPLGAMGTLDLGALAAGDERELLLVASLPRTAGNALQGAAVSAAFEWTAQEVVAPTPTATPVPQPDPGSTPPPVATPVVPPALDPTGGAVVTTIGGVPVDRVLQLPAAKSRCVSRRKFTIHIRAPRGIKFRSVKVTVNRRTRANLKGKRVRTRISLRGLPRGTAKVKILAVTTKGVRVATARTYHTCARTTVKRKAKKRRRR
jgi:hypothetical protein